MSFARRLLALQLRSSTVISARQLSVNSPSPTMVKAKKFVYKTPFVGEPKVTDFELVEEELPAVGENGRKVNYFLVC